MKPRSPFKVYDALPAWVFKGTGSRFYRDHNGELWIVDDELWPWRQRSTIRPSPLWGLRSGSAVDSERRRFSNRWWLSLDYQPGRVRMLSKRRNNRRFYPGKYSRWD